MAKGTYLDEIVASHRARAGAEGRDLQALRAAATSASQPVPRGFRRALTGHGGLAVIAEIKRRSPSRGDLDRNLDPARTAVDYEAGGAVCLSVLTDASHFGGSAQDLRAARHAVALPVLRKDFTVCEADVLDARLMGADAVLLIVAALSDQELGALHSLALELGLDALVEVHDEAELDRALAVGAGLVGVNQRDLRTFEVDEERARALAALIPAEVTAVAESGVRSAADAARLAEAGYQAVLVGEMLVSSPDRRAAVAELSGKPVKVRSGVR